MELEERMGLQGCRIKIGDSLFYFFFLSIFGKWMFSFCFRLSVFHNARTHITKTNNPVSVGFSLNCISFSFGHKM